MEILHTAAYNDASVKLSMLTPDFGPLSDSSLKAMGVLHEEALNQLERGHMRFDEFNELRKRMRMAGMIEMFY